MPTRPMRRLLRERRRIVVVALFSFAAIALAGVPALPLGAAALVALAIGLATGGFAVLAPAARGYAEAAGVANLALAALIRATPGSAMDLAGDAGRAAPALAVWIGLVALARGGRQALGALSGPRLRHLRFKARAGSRLDIHRLWFGLVPTPGPGDAGGGPDLSAIEEMSLRLGRVRLLTTSTPAPGGRARRAGARYGAHNGGRDVGRDGGRDTALQILEVEAPFHIRLRACEDDPCGVIRATGESEIFLVELGDRRLVLFAHDFPDMPLGRALLAWLDDAPGRMLDQRLARIEQRAHAEDRGWPVTAAPGEAKGNTPALSARPETLLEAWDADAALDAPSPPAEAEAQRRAS